MAPGALQETDAQLYVLICTAVLCSPSCIESLFAKASLSATSALTFTTPQNLLNIVLAHTTPVSIPVSLIATLAEDIISASVDPVNTSSDLLLDDLQDLVQWLEQKLEDNKNPLNSDAYLQAANELSAASASSAKELGFVYDTNSSQALSFSFARAKTLHLAPYLPNLADYTPLFTNLAGYVPFDSWYSGVVRPYQYYWENYALIGEKAILLRNYLALESHYSQFKSLIAPLNSTTPTLSGKLSIPMYFSNVILPLAVSHQHDMNPLSSWLTETHSAFNSSAEFLVWDQVLRTIFASDFTSFPIESCTILIKHYIAAGLYYGLFVELNVGSVEKIRIQEQIRTTTSFLIGQLKLTTTQSPTLKIPLVPESCKFSEFVILPSIDSLLDSYEEALLYLNRMVSTCCVLFPVNGMTIRTFLELKEENSIDLDRIKKEIVMIFMYVTEKNYAELLNALKLLCDVFVSDIDRFQVEIASTVFERLMDQKMFSLAIEFLRNPDYIVPDPKLYLNIAMTKLWANLNAAKSLDEALSSSLATQQCVEIIESVISVLSFDDIERNRAVGLKHLFRALSLLKNFKFHLNKGESVTPKGILDKLTRVDVDEPFTPMSLVSVILEQNRKAYLVHEKLYKISVDLAIYLGIDDSWASFYKVRSACIESALVERDFNFAYKQSKELLMYAIEQEKGETLNEIWLIFLQVGKFVPREWMDDFDLKVHNEKITILEKQREILSLALKYVTPSALAGDNSTLLVVQFRDVNDKISHWYTEDASLQESSIESVIHSAQTSIQENVSGFVQGAAKSKTQASEKLSNMFVSGLGWAIGANTANG